MNAKIIRIKVVRKVKIEKNFTQGDPQNDLNRLLWMASHYDS